MAHATSRLENLRNLQVANIDVAFSTAFGTLVGGAFLIGFVRFLGGNDFWVQLTVALPSFMGLAQIPGAAWGRGFPYYQRFITPGGWIWRLLYAPLILLPLLPWPGQVSLLVLAACLLFATLAVQIVGPIYNDWIAELVPANSRGWYFSRRTAISTAVAMAMAFLGGLIVDAFKRNGQEAVGYSALFGLGFVCAIVSMVFFLRMKDTVRPNPVRLGLRESLLLMTRPAKDVNFRRVIWFTVVFMIGATVAGGLYASFAFESLGMSLTQLQITQVAHAVGTVLTARFWGSIADRYGNKPVMAILMAGTILTPGMWLLCFPGDPNRSTMLLTLGHIYNGAVWSGIGVCHLNLMIATSDPVDRPNYLGLVLAVQSLTGGIAPMIGALAMTQLRTGMPAEVAYKVLFVSVMVIRVIGTGFVFPIREEGARALGETLSQLGRFSRRGAAAFRRLSTLGDATGRAEAIATVGTSKFSLAGGEVVKALEDPSPHVRRQAAISIAQMRERETTQALIAFIEEHPELVEEETLEAVGDLRVPTAFPTVARFLQDPRSLLRRQAAKTLGKLGSADAVQPLSAAAMEQGDPDLRRAAIQALRLLGAVEAAPAIADALLDPHPSVRTAAAEAVSELRLKELAPNVRQAIQSGDPATSSELAYALGTIGEKEDTALIGWVAAHAQTLTTRKRCLLALARLYGVEESVYRLVMLDGFSRDSVLMNELRRASSKSPELRRALQLYSAGNESEAISALCEGPDCAVAPLAEVAVEDVFLVAALAYAKAATQGSPPRSFPGHAP
ncbi:MAG: MFS transporter [Fimbriimonadaceae bacterium]|nr:MAG: MFS transporter [Fimbriimonadaceae bacterium]